MLTYGCTAHFIVPELDGGQQIIYQSTFLVPPGLPLEEIIRRGQTDNEPHCLVEGVRRVVDGEVRLHFNRVVVGKYRGQKSARAGLGPVSAISAGSAVNVAAIAGSTPRRASPERRQAAARR